MHRIEPQMTVDKKKLRELSSGLQQTYSRALEAVKQKNYKYAIEMLYSILLNEPGFIEGRKTLRQAQLDNVASKNSLVLSVTASGAVMKLTIKGGGLLKKEKYAEALDLAERAMTANPHNLGTLKFLSQASLEAGLPEIASGAMDIAVRENSKNIALLREATDVYFENKEADKCVQSIRSACEQAPSNLDLENERKQMTAKVAMMRGKWDKAESYRDMIKDVDEAEALEQKEKMVARDEDAIESLLKRELVQLKANENVTSHKKIAELYRRKKDFDSALKHLDKINELMNARDATVDKLIHKVICDRFEDAINQWESYAEKEPSEADNAAAQIEGIKQQKQNHIVEYTKEQVERYPNESEFRYDLGKLLWEQESIDEALANFQHAMKNPRFKRQSLIFIGKCMMKKGMPDLAIDQFNHALAESEPGMSTNRKELMYELACAYQEKGDAENASKTFKEIFTADAAFKDVGERLNTIYKNNAQ